MTYPKLPQQHPDKTAPVTKAGGMKTTIAILTLAALSACASEPSRPLTAREQQDLRECRFAASTVGGYNMVNQAVNQEVAFRNCLAARGY